jgi:hypothetical protein
MRRLLIGVLAAVAIAVAGAPMANAQHYRGYLDALDAFGMIDHTNSNSCATWVDSACKFSQFNADGEGAIRAGDYVCDQLDAGRVPGAVADDFSEGCGTTGGISSPLLSSSSATVRGGDERRLSVRLVR